MRATGGLVVADDGRELPGDVGRTEGVGLGEHMGGGRAADGQRQPQLLDRLGVAEGDRGGLPAVAGDPDGELDRALLVRAQGVARPATVHRLSVVGEHDLLGPVGDPLDADQHSRRQSCHQPCHQRSRSLAGSRSGVASTDPTVTG